MKVLVLGGVLLLAPWGTLAADPVDQLDSVVNDLQTVVSDLDTAQTQVADLRSRLTALEALSSDHLADLKAQETLLDEFRASVAALEDHDRASLALAQGLRHQLDTERALNQWLLPAAGIALAAAVVEGFFLWK
jgi:DNA repair ATPase RecN